MDLHQDFNAGLFGYYFVPDFVNVERDRGLGDPGEGFGEQSVDTIEVYSAIPKAVKHGTGGVKAGGCSFMPLFDTWMRSEPPCLEKFSLMNGCPCSNSHSPSASSVVSPVDKRLSKLALFGESGTEFGIIRMRFHKFFERWDWVIVQIEPVEKMEVNSDTESVFKFIIISLPYDDLEVGAVKVSIADSVSRIRDEEFPDVRQGLVGEKVHSSSPLGMFCRFPPLPNAFSPELNRKVSVPATL